MESRKGDAAQYWQAVAEGALALPPAAAPSSSAGASPGQAAEVALLCLERLASLVAHNAAVGGRDLAVQLAPVAGLLERLVRLEHEGSQQSGPGRLRVLLFHRVSPPCVVVLCFTPSPPPRELRWCSAACLVHAHAPGVGWAWRFVGGPAWCSSHSCGSSLG